MLLKCSVVDLLLKYKGILRLVELCSAWEEIFTAMKTIKLGQICR